MSHAKLAAILMGCLMLAAALIELPGVLPVSAASAAADADKKAPATFEIYKDKAGEFRWRLRMQNTKVIATSGEGYKEKESCMKAIESVKHVAADAPVKEVEATDSAKEGGSGAKQTGNE